MGDLHRIFLGECFVLTLSNSKSLTRRRLSRARPGLGMETDANKIASGGKRGYIGPQSKGKTEIPDSFYFRVKKGVPANSAI